jgi:hypothetical protein
MEKRAAQRREKGERKGRKKERSRPLLPFEIIKFLELEGEGGLYSCALIHLQVLKRAEARL